MLRLSQGWLLLLLTLSNLLIYVDRGILSALVVHLRLPVTGLGLSDTEAGTLGSVFMFGYMITSPFFAHAVQYYHALTLVAVGLAVWILATAAAGVASTFWMLLAARALTGVGEAAICPIVPPLLMETAPADKKTLWLSTYFAAMPIGVALGYIYGEEVTDLLGDWHYPFLIEGVLMLPFLLVFMFADKSPTLRKSPSKTDPALEEGRVPFLTQIRLLFTNYTYMCIVLGQCAYVFTVGGLAFWVRDT